MKTCFYYLLLLPVVMQAQNTRIKDHNTIGWYNVFATTKLNENTSIHTEYQWRRDQLIRNWQQSLLRVGVNYQPNPFVQFRLGYGWIETFPYGDYAINAMGKDFTEHRLFEVVTLNTKVNTLDLQHRFMLEQRWLGRYSNAQLEKEDLFVYVNRIRYMLRLQKALSPKMNKHPYAAAYNELFIGFGKNVNENVFDQNRLALLLGYKFSRILRMEMGFFQQTVQLPREIDSRNVFQYNRGMILNTYFTLDAMRKRKNG